MLRSRLQRTTVLHFQQPASTPTRKVGYSKQVILPALWGGVHENDGAQWAYGTRQVQTTATELRTRDRRKTEHD